MSNKEKDFEIIESIVKADGTETRPNSRCVRFSSTVARLIKRACKDNFNDGFEKIVLEHLKAEADRKKKLTQLDLEIENKKKELQNLSQKCSKFESIIRLISSISNTADYIQRDLKAIDENLKEINK